MMIHHLGNTANNAYYHHLIYKEHGLDSQLPIREFGLRHAMSHPAWESLSFEPKSYSWVEKPDWSEVDGGPELELTFIDQIPRFARRQLIDSISRRLRATARLIAGPKLSPVIADKVRAFNSRRRGKRRRYLKSHVDTITAALLSFRDALFPSGNKVFIVYGANFVAGIKPWPVNPKKTIIFEHGTLRWAGLRPASDNLQSWWYDFATKSSCLLVTNLDPPSLHVARENFSGDWLAYPHPYVFLDYNFTQVNSGLRERLLKELDSEYLIFLPSSQNWNLSYHNKGSDIAWEAFFNLRKNGVRVGLIASEWGLEVEAAKIMVQKSGYAKHVSWQVPIPRIPMMRLLHEVDMCWDQFSIQGFGATALKAVETGTPLLSQGLSEEATELTGFQVPWHVATSAQNLMDATTNLISEISRAGFENVREETRDRYHRWFWKYHSPDVVVALSELAFERVRKGKRFPLNPDSWRRVCS